MSDITRRILSRNLKDTDSQSYIGKKGETFYDSDKKELRFSDGSTPGGISAGIGSDVNINTTGVITSTKFVGDGSGLTNVTAIGSVGIELLDDGFPVGTAATVNFGPNLTVSVDYGVANVNVDGVYQWVPTNAGIHTTKNVGIGVTNPTSKLTVSGDAQVSGIVTATSFVKSGGTSNQFLKADGSVDSNVYLTAFSELDTLNSVTTRGNTTSNSISVGVVTATSFVKSGGTSNQFLKADGTVDSTTYLTSTGNGSGLTGIVTSITSGTGISINQSTGNVTITATSGGGFSQWANTALGIHTTSNVGIGTTSSTSRLTVNGDARFTGVITATSFVKSGGTSSQFLKADGSVDSNAYLTTYSETDTLNTVTGRGNTTTNSISVGVVTATSFIKSGGASNQFLKADGSIDSTTYLTSTGNGSGLSGIVTTITAGSGISINQSTGNVTITATSGGGSSQWENTALGIHTTSNVGIGTTSSTSRLTVSGDARFTGVVTATSFVKSGGTSSQFLKADGTVDSTTYLTSTSSGSGLSGIVTTITAGSGISINQSTGNVIITNTGGGGGGSSSQWVTTNAGIHTLSNVGIGTTNPTQSLEVSGSALIKSTLTVGSDPLSALALTTGTIIRPNGDILIQGGGQSSNRNSIFLGNNSGIIIDGGSSFTQGVELKGGGGDVKVTQGNLLVGSSSPTGTASQPLQVTGSAYVSGNLGIGTANPTTKLQVNGIIGFVDSNIRIGNLYTGGSITTGTLNIFLGRSAGTSNQTGSHNNFFGSQAGAGNTSGNNNNFFGCYAGLSNNNGSCNTFIGPVSGYNNASGCHNIFMGCASGFCNTTGNSNIFIGQQTGYFNSSGGCNNIMGRFAGTQNTTGNHNNFFGNFAGYSNNTGSHNVFFGCYSGRCNVCGNYNNFFGNRSGFCNTTGFHNTFFGSFTGLSNTASRKIIIGSGFNSAFLFDVPDFNKDYQFAVGMRSDTQQAKYWLIGNESFNVGIGTTNPQYKLDVSGTIRLGSTLTDVNNVVGAAGSILVSTGFGVSWANAVSGSVSISTDTTNLNQYIPYVTSLGSTTGFGATNSLVFNPSSRTLTAGSFVGDGSGLTNIVSTGSGVEIRDDGSPVGTASTLDFGGGISASINFGVATISATNPSQWVTTNAGIHTLSNVGIGTTIPISKLYVGGDFFATGIGTFNNQIRVGSLFNPTIISAGGISGVGQNMVISAGQGGAATENSSISELLLRNNDGTTLSAHTSGAVGLELKGGDKYVSVTRGPLLVGTATSTGTASQTLQVATGGAYVSGNLGIGSASPTSKLYVVGDTRIVGTVTATSFVGDGSGLVNIVATGSGIQIRDDGAIVGTAATIDFGTNLSVTFGSGIATVTASGGGGSSSQWATTNAGINTVSNVGVGTTNPQSTLQIERYGVKTGFGTFSASVGTATDIDSFDISVTNFKTAEYTLHIEYPGNIQSQKVLVIQNGTTAYSQEYAVMYQPNLLVSVGATMSGNTCKLQVTPETGVSGLTTYRFVRETML